MWLHVPRKFCPSSPASPALTSPSSSLCHALARSATWRGKSLPPKSWRRALRTALSTTRLSGLTCEPSILGRGVEKWIRSLADSPARTSATPAKGRASTKALTPVFGGICSESFAAFDRRSLLWRTSALSLFGECDEFLGTWPKRGFLVRGMCFRCKRSAGRRFASGSFSWPTPDCNRGTYSGGEFGLNLREAAELWPTANATDGTKAPSCFAGGNLSLPEAAKIWPSPNNGEALRGSDAQADRQGGMTLTGASSLWASPSSSMPNDVESPESWLARAAEVEAKHSNGNGMGMPIAVQAMLWATPAARDYRSPNLEPYRNRGGASKGEQLVNQVAFWGGAATDANRSAELVGEPRGGRRRKHKQGRPKDQGETLERTGADVGESAGDGRQAGSDRGSGDGAAASPVEVIAGTRAGVVQVPYWPPGPADRDGWERVLAARPELAPATTQSAIRGMAARSAFGLGVARADQLRGLGNLVVPIQGAFALATLWRRLFGEELMEA